jgi:hypothetical protein
MREYVIEVLRETSEASCRTHIDLLQQGIDRIPLEMVSGRVSWLDSTRIAMSTSCWRSISSNANSSENKWI